MINLPSAPPIILRLYKKKAIEKVKITITALIVKKNTTIYELNINSMALTAKMIKNVYLKKEFGILRYFISKYKL